MDPAHITTTNRSDLEGGHPATVRAAVRSGVYTGGTAGLAPGYLQANLAILPARYAAEFEDFCRFNPAPCPLVAVTRPGDPRADGLGDIDLRYDVPRYNVYCRGTLVDSVTDIERQWRADFVAFVLGCSFTFESALAKAGFRLRHLEENRTVPMYRTSLQTLPSGPFGGGMVVSMRPIPISRVDEAVALTAAYPQAHGAPVHIGDPGAIGIADLDHPDWGQPVTVRPGEVPVFWACGVTPQNALRAARPEICITHAPGHMLVTDIDEFADVGGFRPARRQQNPQ